MVASAGTLTRHGRITCGSNSPLFFIRAFSNRTSGETRSDGGDGNSSGQEKLLILALRLVLGFCTYASN